MSKKILQLRTPLRALWALYLFAPATLVAQEPSRAAISAPISFRVDDAAKDRDISLGLNSGLIQSDLSSILHSGFWLDYEQFPWAKQSVELRFSTAFMVAGFGHLYSAIGIGTQRYLIGDSREGSSTVIVDDRTFLERRRPRAFSLSAGGGFEQLILSGSSSIIPAPGFYASSKAKWPLGERSLIATLRVGYYLTSDNPFLGISAGAGLSF